MKFAFIADIPGWALHREGLGLVKYGSVDGHSWDLYHCNPFDFTADQLEPYDAIRPGSASNILWMKMHGKLPWNPLLVASVASFWDIPRATPEVLASIEMHADAFAVVDPRLLEHCARFGRPSFVFSDRCDHEFFYPMPAARPSYGPLRVGWAGSQSYWPGVKNREWIEQACAELGLVFVRQDRELDGTKNADEMRAWYASLDMYGVANITDTPTPVPWIEAAACGVQVIGTRCGELWQPLQEHCAASIVQDVSRQAVFSTLSEMAKLGRAGLHTLGHSFRDQNLHRLYWHLSTAQQHTREIAALCAGGGA